MSNYTKEQENFIDELLNNASFYIDMAKDLLNDFMNEFSFRSEEELRLKIALEQGLMETKLNSILIFLCDGKRELDLLVNPDSLDSFFESIQAKRDFANAQRAEKGLASI